MSDKKSVIALTLGAPFDRTSRSGVNHAVLSRMSQEVNLIAAYDCSLTGFFKYVCAAKSFSFNFRNWKRKYHQNPYAFEKRSTVCDNHLKQHEGSYDAVYQDGAMFMPRNNNKLFVTNHDANVILTSKGGEFSVGAHYRNNPSMLRKTIEQEKEVYERADHIFVRSNWVRDSLIMDFKIKGDKISINPSGVHFDVPDILEKEYKGKDILYVGKELPIKGYDILLRAFKIMAEDNNKATLHIVGTSHTSEMSNDRIKYYGFLGSNKISVLKELFTLADLFILPSRYDAFPKVLIEAGAYRIPCISTRVCGIPEIISDGINGFLVEPGDYVAIAQRGLEILKDCKLSREMGKAGFRNYKEKFNWDRHVSEIVRVINEKA